MKIFLLQIRDTNLYSDTDLKKHVLDLNNQILNDY